MGNEPKNQFSLTVKTGDKAAENFIINSQFRRVDGGVGEESVFTLPEGLYSVKVRAGAEYQEEMVDLFQDQEISFAPIPFPSPVPLQETKKTSVSQISSAIEHSKSPTTNIGKGSQLYVFVRNTGRDQSDFTISDNYDAATGLKLHDADDNLVVDFGDPDTGFYSTGTSDAWSACNIELDPGIYILCLETETGEVFRQTIVISPAWQTQVFMQLRNYGIKKKDIRADLADSSVFMAGIGQGFSPDTNVNDVDFRLTELVRQALKDKRNVLSNDVIESMVNGKARNPMLGIYAVHLSLLNNKFDHSRLITIVDHLRKLLVQPHPDVEALALKLGMPGDYLYTVLPMLSASWNHVLEASVKRPEIVVDGSLACKYAGQFWNCELWLIWGRIDKEGHKNLVAQVKKYTEQGYADTTNPSPDQVMAAQNEIIFTAGDSLESFSTRGMYNEFNEHVAATGISNEKILPIVQALGVPRAKVDELLREISTEEKTNPEISERGIELIDANNNDPQKGEWGGEPERDFRRISATVDPVPTTGFYTVIITVESTNINSPLSGTVTFHLHDTFLNPDPAIPVKEGKAVLKLTDVWGSFTVGAETDNGDVKLELDLATLPDVTPEFRER